MIVDASIVLKCLIEEVDSPAATGLMARGDLNAPSVLPIEIGYVLTKFLRRRIISSSQARTAWDDSAGLPVAIVDSARLLEPAFDLSVRLTVSFYDSIYLALALATGDVLVTADERFVRAVRSARDLGERVLTLAEAAA